MARMFGLFLKNDGVVVSDSSFAVLTFDPSTLSEFPSKSLIGDGERVLVLNLFSRLPIFPPLLLKLFIDAGEMTSIPP